ncbi:aldose 1-epimerase [Ruminococcus sp.]|uniref:aldose 1-epimerase n=1 Tax=Ruminococcus sp. TaxID=41978 RepID=UPI0025D08E39|nr:aldose 1-epimerase [Ruminococcus sp.]
MKNTATLIDWKGMECVRLSAGGYTALIAPGIGSNVLRLHDDANGVEFFRWDENNTPDDIRNSAEVWGLPTLYLPNRFSDGVLRTSDAVYQLPVNEAAPFHNHIHGFLHKREHTVVAYSANEDGAWLRTAYVYNESDPFFQYFPLPFTAEFFFVLSEYGLEYKFSIINQSPKKLPISIATHTTIAAPFVDGAKEEDIRIQVPVTEKWTLNQRCLPTGEILPLSDYDMAYKNGTTCPVKRVVDNDMYTAGILELDKKPFRGVKMTDTASGKGIGYAVSDGYKFWILWNDRGEKHYFCPEPMTAMIDAPNLDIPAEKTGYRELASGEMFHLAQHFFTILPEA